MLVNKTVSPSPPGFPAHSQVVVDGDLNITSLGGGGANLVPLCWRPDPDPNFRNVQNCDSSSIRYKTNLTSFNSGLNLIKRLRPVSFNWKQGGVPDFGFVAEEVAEAEPLLVVHNPNGSIEGVRYERIGVVLVSAVKAQQAQIEKLQQTIAHLQKQNEQILKCQRALTHQDRTARRRVRAGKSR